MTTASDPEEIRREIEYTQRNLSTDVDLLAEKVTPGRIVQRRVDRARGVVTRARDRVMGTASDGVSTVSDHASSLGDRASSTAGTVKDRAQSMASDAADKVSEVPGAVRRGAEGNPLAAGLIAFGAGWLVSSLLPASRREQELADQARHVAQEVAQEKVQPALQQVASEVGDNLRGPAQDAVASVRSTAVDAKDTVVEEGRSATQDVSGRAQDAAGNVRSTPTGG